MSEEIAKTAHAIGETAIKVTKNTFMVLEKTGPVVTEISNHAWGAGRVTIRICGKIFNSVFLGKRD